MTLSNLFMLILLITPTYSLVFPLSSIFPTTFFSSTTLLQPLYILFFFKPHKSQHLLANTIITTTKSFPCPFLPTFTKRPRFRVLRLRFLCMFVWCIKFLKLKLWSRFVRCFKVLGSWLHVGSFVVLRFRDRAFG